MYPKHVTRDDELGSSSSDSDEDTSSIELVIGEKGRCALLQQRNRVRRVAKDAIHQIEVDLLFKNAFPEGPEKYNVFTRRVLIKCAEAYSDSELVRRLKNDSQYAHDLASIVSTTTPRPLISYFYY